MSDLTYAEVGATRHPVLPPGYAHAGRDEAIGHGRPCFERAAEGLFGWHMHRGAGLRVSATGPRAAVGVEVTSRLLVFRIPCRVVYVIDRPDEQGFGYGTLPGHPVRGEEAFVLRLTGSGEVRFRIRAFSRPATPLARLGAPVTRLTQAAFTTRYIKSLRSYATS
jgi:uncharacterized protein (UPF0548 family)